MVNEKTSNAASKDEIAQAAAVLNDPKEKISNRFRALFLLRNVDLAGPDVARAARAIGDCLMIKGIKDASALLKHECAYCLGQIGAHSVARPFVVPLLLEALRDLAQPAIARHEAGEALGAIGAHECVDELEQIGKMKPTEAWPVAVIQTCELAAARIRYVQSDPKLRETTFALVSPFDSIDPTPPEEKIRDVKALGATLADLKKPLFDRYKAMFSLRNIAGSSPDAKVADEAVRQLARGFENTTPEEALLRHEVAFVMGQLGARAEKAGIAPLKERLQDINENPMVRHEAAEALGAVATEECTVALQKFAADPEPVVYESCVVALDLAEYERSESFEYATVSS